MSNGNKIVDLQKLVQNPNSLKLLILHTPFTLEISSLWRCSNLIKLDLSKNNLQKFPYIGNLMNLKFMFLHQNKLDHHVLRGIFYSEDQPTYSSLSRSIVWVTFWGNKNPFFARHFLINQTSVIAVDNHMVVSQQRKQSVIINNLEPFCKQTDISYILSDKSASLGKNATQQQYMDQFWDQMRQLRKKIQQMCPIIKIQKRFRGWILRKKLRQAQQQISYNNYLLAKAFQCWNKQVKLNKKLQFFLSKRKKQHFLLPLKQMKLQSIKYKMLEWAARAKKKVFLRKFSLSKQMRFYHILRSNMLMFRSLYYELQIQKSNFLLVDVMNFRDGFTVIKHFISLFNVSESFQVIDNAKYVIREIVDGKIKKQFAKFLSNNQRSYVIKLSQSKQQKKIRKKCLLNQNICYLSNQATQLKPIYKNQNKVHFNKKENQKNQKIYNNLQKKQNMILEDFVCIKGSQRVLKDFVRCVFYLNEKCMKIDEAKNTTINDRIKLFSQKSLNRLSAVPLIQRFWRGYIFRKNQKANAQICAKQFRAAVKIQRWIRNLPLRKRYRFRNQVNKILKNTNDCFFYINMVEYFSFIQSYKDPLENYQNRMKLIQQNITPYINLGTKKIRLYWNPNFSISSQFNQTIKNCFQIKKNPFDEFFIKNLFKCNTKQVFSNFIEQQNSKDLIQIGDISHLFHFNTRTQLFQRFQGSWMKICSNSILQTKIRVLGILSKSFSLKKGFQIKIYNTQPSQFKKQDVKCIFNSQSIFITKDDVTLSQTTKIQKFTFKTKIYLKDDIQKKPNKIQQSLLIFISKPNQATFDRYDQINQNKNYSLQLNKYDSIKVQNPKKKPKLYIDQIHFSQAGNLQNKEIHERKSSMKIQEFSRQNTQKDQLLPHALKRILPLKKQIKSYKVQKRIKKRQPSFILDNVNNKIQRMHTQPDLTSEKNFQVQKTQKSEQNLLHYSSVKQRVKSQYMLRKNMVKSKKQDSSFYKNFMNLNNFLQQQSIAQQRRRIKTQLELQAYQSADKIRSSLQRSTQSLIKSKQTRMKKVQNDIKIHKQTLQKHRISKQQYKSQLQKAKSIQRQKVQQKKLHMVKRLKVSFAQQCFPIINRSYSNIQRNQKIGSENKSKQSSKQQQSMGRIDSQKKYIISSQK